MSEAADVQVFVTPGLGDSSYLLASAGEAAIVDPQRDADRMLAVTAARHLQVRTVLETHVHNDYVTGAAEIRAATGAEIAGPASAGYAFATTAMEEGTELAVGELRLVAMATPGHTPEHMSYVLLAPGREEPAAVFSGGSLMVGTAGRTDLLGADRAEELTRAQYRSLRRFDAMPEAALVLPTHGAGSFCAIGTPREGRTSTIGNERRTNPALSVPDEQTFVLEHLSGLLAFPAYYAHMAAINRAGPDVHGGVPQPEQLSAEQAARRLDTGARLVDARRGAAYASAHVPGSLNSPLEDSFASYVGWLVPFGTPIVLVTDDEAGRKEAAVQLFRIGYEQRLAYLEGGVDAWAGSGRPLSSYPVATVDDLLAAARAGGERILDVRQTPEWEAGHIEGSRHCFVADVPVRLPDLRRIAEITVACASGQRSAIAASLLDAAGVPVRLVAEGGVPDVLPQLS